MRFFCPTASPSCAISARMLFHLQDLTEPSHFLTSQRSIRARLQSGQFQEADPGTLQLLDKKAEVLEHDADLVLTAFGDRHLIPRVFSGSNQAQARRSGPPPMHGNALSELHLLVSSQPS